MSVSMEALAMAGADCMEFGVNLQEWESKDLEMIPPHLLAQAQEEEEEEVAVDPRYKCCVLFEDNIPSKNSLHSVEKVESIFKNKGEGSVHKRNQQASLFCVLGERTERNFSSGSIKAV